MINFNIIFLLKLSSSEKSISFRFFKQKQITHLFLLCPKLAVFRPYRLSCLYLSEARNFLRPMMMMQYIPGLTTSDWAQVCSDLITILMTFLHSYIRLTFFPNDQRPRDLPCPFCSSEFTILTVNISSSFIE